MLILPIAATLASCTESSPPPQTERPQNVVVLCIDTLRRDHVGSYGYRRNTTPNVDRLTREGTLFETARAASNWTVPATASLLTGLTPSQHGAGLRGEVRYLQDVPPAQMAEGAQSLADAMKSGGLATGLFSANPFLYGRFKRGFDRAVISRQSAGDLTDEALAWLAEVGEDPFFLYVQYMDLHHPIEPPAPFFDHFAEGFQIGPEHEGWSYGNLADPSDPHFRLFRQAKLALYDGALLYVDAQIGRIAAWLESRGVLGRTLLVVTADHGEEFWDHAKEGRELGGDPRGIWGVGHGHSMFGELLDLPLIIRGPGVAEGRRVSCVTGQIDVAPTLLAAMGRPRPDGLRGIDLGPLMDPGIDAEACVPRMLVAESVAYGPEQRALFWSDHKLIERADGKVLLFDLRSDPGEETDLSGSEPSTLAELRALSKEVGDGDRATGEVATEYDPETIRQLRALGYVP